MYYYVCSMYYIGRIKMMGNQVQKTTLHSLNFLLNNTFHVDGCVRLCTKYVECCNSKNIEGVFGRFFGTFEKREETQYDIY